MSIELKNFKGGGMDSDSAVEALAPNDYVEAYNVRNRDGVVSDMDSTELISGTRPAGIGKGIGGEGFEQVRKGYGFVYNSQGFHQLVEIDYDTETETVLFTNKTDSLGLDILKLDPKHYQNDIKLVHGKFLVFTDGNSGIGCINLERLKSGYYQNKLREEDIRLIKAQPLAPPTSVYGDDAGRSVNLLSGRLFQFTEQFVYLDDEYSAWSTRSKRTVPTTQSTSAIGTDVTKANHLIVTVDAGSDRVKILNIGARYDMLDWFLIKSVERSRVLSLPSAIDVAAEVYEAYNPVTNQYSFVFYNDGNYANIDALETDLNYDAVPEQAGTLEVLNGSILALGDITEGRPKPESVLQLSASAYDPNLTVPNGENPDPLKVSYMFKGAVGSGEGNHRRRMIVHYIGTPKEGDRLFITVHDIRNTSAKITYEHQVTSAQAGDRYGVVRALAAKIPNSSVSFQVGTAILTFVGDPYYELLDAPIRLFNAGSGQFKSIHALKSNSAYQVALQYRDKNGKFFPLVDGGTIKTPSYAQTQGLTPVISWSVNGPVPNGAADYQILLSENNTHAKTLFVDAVLKESLGDYWILNINPLLNFNEKNSSSVLNYDFAEGDRCTFHKNDTDNSWFNSPSVDVEVVDFLIEVTKEELAQTNYLLKVRKSAGISSSSLSGKNLLIEIYTPKKRADMVNGALVYNTNLFYEVGERFPIVNGKHSVQTGSITDGDVYFKTRELAKATDMNVLQTFLVEDFHFSDFYRSNYTSYGRARTLNDEQGVVHKGACIRYSDTYLLGSQINGMSRFFPERIYGESGGQTSSSHGDIRKLFLRDNYLVCIQERKVGHIPVYTSILEDQMGKQNVAISDQILGNIRYSRGNYGMGSAKESFAKSNNGTVYFIDPDNSVPVRDGADGVRTIPGKMTKFFRTTLQRAIKQGKKIIGLYDNFNDEYIVSIEQDGDVLVSFPFRAGNWKVLNDNQVLASSIELTKNPDKGALALIGGGKAVYTPTTGMTGSDSFTFKAINEADSSEVIVNGCITILPGNSQVNEFVFIDLFNQELNTLMESNAILIDGINVPVPISVVGGEYRVNDGAWTSDAGTVKRNDTVQVRGYSSSEYGELTSVVLTVSGYSDSFDMRTRAEIAESVDVTVDISSFSDVPQAGVENSEIRKVIISGKLSSPLSQPIFLHVVVAQSYIPVAVSTQTVDTTINPPSIDGYGDPAEFIRDTTIETFNGVPTVDGVTYEYSGPEIINLIY